VRHDRLVPFPAPARLVSFLWGKTHGGDGRASRRHVFPMVPVRQWVLSIPFALRYRLAYDSCLLSDILNISSGSSRPTSARRPRPFGIEVLACGAVKFVQRCGDALNLAPHFHSLVINGVYAADENGQPDSIIAPTGRRRCCPSCGPRCGESRVAVETSRPRPGRRSGHGRGARPGRARFGRHLFRFIRGRIASGPRAGNRVMTVGGQVDGDNLDPLQSHAAPWCPDSASMRT